MESRVKHVPPEEPRRNYAARGIAALLAPVLRPAFKKRSPASAALLADWQSLAGPKLAARAAAIKFSGGTLSLACTGPMAMELQLSAPQIIARLNLALGHNMVERLRFVRHSASAPAKPKSLTPHVPGAPPENLPDGPLGEALAKLYRGLQEAD